MTKDEIKAILAELLSTGEFEIETDEAQTLALIDRRVKPLAERVEKLEAASKPARIDPIAAAGAKPTIKVKLGRKGGAS